MKTFLRLLLKKALAPIIYRHVPVGLDPIRQYIYMDWLYKTKDVSGIVLEVGCNVGGTAALAQNMLRQLGSTKQYICIDTVSGFVDDQFEKDVALGNRHNNRRSFAANDISLTRKILAMHDAEEVQLIQADIVNFDAEKLPGEISLCLIDVDLYEPVLAALRKVYPMMVKSSVILVDDCNEETNWQARKAYCEFVRAHDLPVRVEFWYGDRDF